MTPFNWIITLLLLTTGVCLIVAGLRKLVVYDTEDMDGGDTWQK